MSEGKQVFIIDDHADLLEAMSLRLKGAGFQVHAVESGRKALELISVDPPDIVVCDVQMPEMDGFTFFKELKRLCRESEDIDHDIPVIMMTGVKKGPAMEELFEMEGAIAYMEKPISGKVLIAKIHGILGSK